MKCIVLSILVGVILFASSARGQTQCPTGLVCISPEAARTALQQADTVVAQQKELAAKDQAIADFQKELNAMRIELAKAIGEKTGSEQMVVRLTAIIDFMLKNGRTKKYGIINF